MGEERRYTATESHRQFAVDLFNLTWDLLEKEGRTQEEDERMVHAAHASRFHWGEVGEARNLAVGEWQIARVYATLGRPQPALRHARRSLEIIEANHISGFHRASAYEGLARAYSVAGDTSEARRFIQLAKEEAEQNYGSGRERTPLRSAERDTHTRCKQLAGSAGRGPQVSSVGSA